VCVCGGYQTLVTRDVQIKNFWSNQITNQIGGYDSNSNQGVIVYVFNDEQ